MIQEYRRPFVCEYDFTIASKDRTYLNKCVAETINPKWGKHVEITEEEYQTVQRGFWSGEDIEYIKNHQIYIHNNCFIFKYNNINYFSYVIQPGLNGEQWYYGKFESKSAL
jgi:hypothetical protein